jgi:hypothetical protein
MEERVNQVSHLAFCHLAYLTAREWSLQLQNLATELQAEKGPFSQAVRSHAQASVILFQSASDTYGTCLRVRDNLGVPPRAHTLFKRQASLLNEVDRRVCRILKRAIGQDEGSAYRTIKLVCRSAIELAGAAKKIAKRALELVDDAKGQPRHGIIPPPSIEDDRSVVSIDLAEYGRLAVMLQEVGGSSRHLLDFNNGIQRFFGQTMAELRIEPNEVPSLNTGDGALMFFKSPTPAFRFALRLQEEANDANRSVTDPNHRKCYRIGICTGRVCIQESRTEDGRLVRAVRLQAACDLNRVLICEETWARLPPLLRSKKCGEVQEVGGKGHEKTRIPCRACSP